MNTFITNVLLTFVYSLIISTSNTSNGQNISNATEEMLLLTPLIKSGNITEAKNQAKVNHPDFNVTESYSGYLTVNETCGSNLFFWFFPAENNPETAAVVLYLNGGPGYSSVVCVLDENGPFNLLENGEVVRANYSWSQYYNLLYIDNPVGVGFSFTGTKDCMAKDETRVGTEMYDAIIQFFQLFPNLQKNDFYLSGVSYAGHYVPATAYIIHKRNPSADLQINLKGLAIESGFIDMRYQYRYSPYLYEIGLVDEEGRKQLEDAENELKKALDAENWDLAVKLGSAMIWNYTGETLFTKLTGLEDYDNYIDNELLPVDYDAYFNRSDIRKALHVGNVSYVTFSEEVLVTMQVDFVKGVTPMLIEILNSGYKVLLYNGQLDICVAYPLTRDLVNQIEFKGKSEFQAAKRFIWQSDEDIAGYVREGGNLTLALVRDAGHAVAEDQPKWVRDLLVGFTNSECVEFKENRRMLSEKCEKHTVIS